MSEGTLVVRGLWSVHGFGNGYSAAKDSGHARVGCPRVPPAANKLYDPMRSATSLAEHRVFPEFIAVEFERVFPV
jgi:hypothetical protein